jgi:hypothetical protein
MERQAPHPYAGSWEGPWEGRNAFWMYPVQGHARLEIAADGAVTAQLSISPGGARSQWQGQMLANGEIELETIPVGNAQGNAHGVGELLPSERLQVKLLIGGLQTVPFDAELELTRRADKGRDREGQHRKKQGLLQVWRERLRLRRILRLHIAVGVLQSGRQIPIARSSEPPAAVCCLSPHSPRS